MQIEAFRNLGTGWPPLKEGEISEVDDRIGSQIVAAGLGREIVSSTTPAATTPAATTPAASTPPVIITDPAPPMFNTAPAADPPPIQTEASAPADPEPSATEVTDAATDPEDSSDETETNRSSRRRKR